MKKIAFYISDHGFGHASRNIPIIKYILDASNDIQIIVRTGKAQGEFMDASLKIYNERIDYYLEKMDIGLVLKDNSLEIDKERLNNEVKNYVASWNYRISKEKGFIKKNNIQLVVCDIVPWVIKACKFMGINSILISNFTWFDIYKEYLSEEVCNVFMECYSLVSKAIFYEFYIKDMERYINNFEKVSLCCRSFNVDKVKEIRSNFNKPIVFISVGCSVSLRNPIDVESLNYNFIATEGVAIKGENVYYLNRDVLNTQDYIMASDYIISKAGWSTIAETLMAKKKMAVISRSNIKEDRETLESLLDKELVVEVKYNDKLSFQDILSNLKDLNIDNKYENFKNDFKMIGEKIISYTRGEYR